MKVTVFVPYSVGADTDCAFGDHILYPIEVTKREIMEAVAKDCNGEIKGNTVYAGNGDKVKIRWEEIE